MVKLYDKLAINQGVVLDLDFAEATGSALRDRSKNHNNGTLGAGAASPTWVQRASSVWALSFDGGDNVEVADSASLDISTAYSIEIVVQPNIAGQTILFTKWNQTLNQRSWAILIALNSLAFYYSTDGINSAPVSWSPPIAVSSLYHIIWTYDGTTIRCFSGGIQLSSNYAIPALFVGTSPVWLGRDGTAGLGAQFNGQVALAKIWNIALAPRLVLNRYQGLKGRFAL